MRDTVLGRSTRQRGREDVHRHLILFAMMPRGISQMVTVSAARAGAAPYILDAGRRADAMNCARTRAAVAPRAGA